MVLPVLFSFEIRTLWGEADQAVLRLDELEPSKLALWFNQ